MLFDKIRLSVSSGCIYPTPLPWGRCIISCNSKFILLTKVAALRSQSIYLQIAEDKDMDSCLCKDHLVQREMKTALSRIWIWFTKCISYGHNLYTMCNNEQSIDISKVMNLPFGIDDGCCLHLLYRAHF